jgi:hypothetical protein
MYGFVTWPFTSRKEQIEGGYLRTECRGEFGHKRDKVKDARKQLHVEELRDL